MEKNRLLQRQRWINALFARDKNYWGGHGIVGGQTPLGLGIAYALKYKKKKGACLCFMEMERRTGSFLRILNLASLWNLPVIYIIENNGYSMGTAESRHSAGDPLARGVKHLILIGRLQMVTIFMSSSDHFRCIIRLHMKNLGFCT